MIYRDFHSNLSWVILFFTLVLFNSCEKSSTEIEPTPPVVQIKKTIIFEQSFENLDAWQFDTILEPGYWQSIVDIEIPADRRFWYASDGILTLNAWGANVNFKDTSNPVLNERTVTARYDLGVVAETPIYKVEMDVEDYTMSYYEEGPKGSHSGSYRWGGMHFIIVLNGMKYQVNQVNQIFMEEWNLEFYLRTPQGEVNSGENYFEIIVNPYRYTSYDMWGPQSNDFRPCVFRASNIRMFAIEED